MLCTPFISRPGTRDPEPEFILIFDLIMNPVILSKIKLCVLCALGGENEYYYRMSLFVWEIGISVIGYCFGFRILNLGFIFPTGGMLTPAVRPA